jgi:hypothetical protein
MSLDRILAEHQLGRDLGVRQPARDEPEHLELALGELGQRLGNRPRGGPCRACELLDVGGAVLVVDERVADEFTASGDEVER